MSSLREDLQRLYDTYSRLVPRDIVAIVAEEPEEYPALHHDLYEKFSDEELADQRREARVREIIRTVKIVRIGPGSPPQPTQVRVYHSVQDPEQTAYYRMDDIVEDDLKVQLLLNQARREFEQMFDRYQHLSEWVDFIRRRVA